MSIEINRTNAQLGIERTPSRLEMRSESARLELHQKHAKVNIRTELPKVKIDQYEAFASAGLKNCYDLIREISQRAYQHVLEYIGKVAEDGDTLAAIERGGNPIADIAERDAYTEHEFGYNYIPKARPKIEVTGSLKFYPERNAEGVNNGVEGRFIPGSLKINYTPAKVKIYMKQYPSISIKYHPDKKIDIRV